MAAKLLFFFLFFNYCYTTTRCLSLITESLCLSFLSKLRPCLYDQNGCVQRQRERKREKKKRRNAWETGRDAGEQLEIVCGGDECSDVTSAAGQQDGRPKLACATQPVGGAGQREN